MRKIVIKKTWPNSLWVIIAVYVICLVVFYPVFRLLSLGGLSDSHTIIIYTSLTTLTTGTILALKVKREPTKPNVKGWIVFYTAIGFLVMWGGVAMRQIFFACIGALLIIVVWVWGIQEHRKTTKKKQRLSS